MRLWKRWILAALSIVIVAAITYMYIASAKQKCTEVRVDSVKRGKITSYLSARGTIESRERIDYFVSNPAKVEKVYVSIGDMVKEDELLIKLEVPDMSRQLNQSYIQLDIALTTLDSLKRQKSEAGKNKGGTFPVVPVNMASTNIDDMIKLQEKQVELARTNVNSIKEKIKSAQSGIKSGIAGVVTNISTVKGADASPRIPVITVENTGSLKAVLSVSEYDALKVKVGQEAVIKLGDEKREYKGIVDRINPTAKKEATGLNAKTGVPVEVTVLNPSGDCKIGSDVYVDIKTGAKEDVLYIPYEAVVRDEDDKDRVFIIEGGKAALKDIMIGMESDFYAEISSGLMEGESIILNPPLELKDGWVVRVWEE